MADIKEFLGNEIIFSKPINIDNSIKNQLTDFSIETLVENFTYRRVYPNNFFYQVNFSNCDVQTNIIQCYGRPCILMDAYAYKGSYAAGTGLQVLGGSMSLYASDGTEAHLYSDNLKFFVNGLHNDDYTEGDPNIEQEIENYTNLSLFNHTEYCLPVEGKFCTELNLFCNVPVFSNLDDVRDYIATGNSSKSINTVSTEDIYVKPDIYYYNYSEQIINDKTHSIISETDKIRAYFKLKNDTDTVAFVKTENEKYELQATCDTVYIWDALTLDYTKEVSLSNVYIEVYKDFHYNDNGTTTVPDNQTNILYVNDLSEAYTTSYDDTRPSFNGKDAIMILNDVNIVTSMIKAYYVSTEEINKIATILYHNDENFIEVLKKGLWLYNENPINCIIDVCYYPISLEPFISSQSTKKLKFGSFVYDGEVESVTQTDYNCITGTNNTFTIVNQKIYPIYNDFRDISAVSYQLFLPYYGFINLDNMIVNKILRIEVKFDVFTSSLKYYLFVDSALYLTVETTIGRHIAMLGTDWITKSNRNLDVMQNQLTSTAESILNPSESAVVGYVNTSLNTIKETLKKPSVTVNGSTNSGMNIYDPLSCYLIVEQYETIKPNNLNSEYGKPTYFIDKLNKCAGYSEVSNVKIRTRATDDERNEILSLLATGIIF